MYSENSSPHFDHCLFQSCHADQSGGGVYVSGTSDIIFDHTVFWACDGIQYGGALYINGTDPLIQNCTIYGNWAPLGGGGICCLSFASPHIVNTIIAGTTSGSGMFVSSSPGLSLTYSCFYNNQSSNFIGNPPPGTGILNHVNANGDSCDVNHNIFMNPLMVNPGAGNFQLQAGSPCIDAGDPSTPLDPDGTIADVGAYYFFHTVAPIGVTLTPLNPPITVPANGGSFQFNAAARRVTGPQALFSVWCRMKYPNGTYTGPTVGPVNINPPVGLQVSRNRTQNIPASYPAGVYTYLGYAANSPLVYPAIDSSWFTFTKLATGTTGPYVWDANCYGEPFPGEVIPGREIHPSSFILHPCNPNPFNPTTTISFELRSASYVSLKVYDTAGRLVATLQDGWRDAGLYEATFDGSLLSSGIYLVHLTSSSDAQVLKLILLK